MKRDERGVVVILFALAMAGIMTMAALVLDLAQLRADRRVNKSVADMAVRAGLGVLQAGPWSGVCRAKDYVRANSPEFSSFDPGSEKWFQLGSPVSNLTSSPCLNTAGAPFVNLCLPGELGIPRTDTWGRLRATAGGGRFTIEIQSGYTMPDSRFPEDQVAAADTGDPLKGSCDNLVVIITERRTPLFGGIVDGLSRTTTIRSVGRLSNISTGEYNPALLLLERHGCDVLVAGSNNTRVIAALSRPSRRHPDRQRRRPSRRLLARPGRAERGGNQWGPVDHRLQRQDPRADARLQPGHRQQGEPGRDPRPQLPPPAR